MIGRADGAAFRHVHSLVKHREGTISDCATLKNRFICENYPVAPFKCFEELRSGVLEPLILRVKAQSR